MNSIYRRILIEDETLTHTELENIDEHGLCYSALLYASRRDPAAARRVLKQIDEKSPDHSCSFVLETKALIYILLREFNAAREFALRALAENPESLFAYSILARLAIFEKKYGEAVQNYRKILEYQPESERTVLNIAETYFLGKNIAEAERYVDMAKPSARKKLYKFLISFNSIKTRFLWMLLIVASFLNPYAFFAFHSLAAAVFVYVFVRFGYKKGDQLIIRRSLYIQAVHTFFLALGACIWTSILSESGR